MKKIAFFACFVVTFADAYSVEQPNNPFGKNRQLRRNSVTVTTPMYRNTINQRNHEAVAVHISKNMRFKPYGFDKFIQKIPTSKTEPTYDKIQPEAEKLRQYFLFIKNFLSTQMHDCENIISSIHTNMSDNKTNDVGLQSELDELTINFQVLKKLFSNQMHACRSNIDNIIKNDKMPQKPSREIIPIGFFGWKNPERTELVVETLRQQLEDTYYTIADLKLDLKNAKNKEIKYISKINKLETRVKFLKENLENLKNEIEEKRKIEKAIFDKGKKIADCMLNFKESINEISSIVESVSEGSETSNTEESSSEDLESE